MAVLWKQSMNCSVTDYSKNHINLEVQEEIHGKWRITAFYGMPERNNRRNSWDLIRTISASSSLPWCFIGDLNDMVNISDKRGGASHSQRLLDGFREVLSDCNLIDMNLEGYPYTWQRKENLVVVLEETLDRALVTPAWLQLFPHARLSNLFSFTSDHTPILLNLVSRQKDFFRRSFRFENKWLTEPDIDTIVNSRWEVSEADNLVDRLDCVVEGLDIWGKQLARRFRDSIDSCKKDMEALRNKGDIESLNRFELLKTNLASMLFEEEIFWRQRAKSFWLKDGDINSKFFHAAATAKREVNKIKKLQDDNGNIFTDHADFCRIVGNYFSQIFEANPSNDYGTVTTHVKPMVTSDDNAFLLRQFDISEFKKAVFHMHPDKSPGPDGLNPAFYQRFWNLIGPDVFDSCMSWIDQRAFPPALNDTNVVLIPKCERPDNMKDLRSISLCNVLYKIFAKVVANRLKNILPKIISEFQYAFVSGRAITDNILVVFEIIHSMKRKSRGKMGDVALKIDIKKAYDRVDWGFLEQMMVKLGFAQKWIDIVMMCVRSV